MVIRSCARQCREVDQVTERTRMILDDMVETMRHAQGVGLAAPQVGIVRRMFVAEPAPGNVYCFVNPEIVRWKALRKAKRDVCRYRDTWVWSIVRKRSS